MKNENLLYLTLITVMLCLFSIEYKVSSLPEKSMIIKNNARVLSMETKIAANVFLINDDQHAFKVEGPKAAIEHINIALESGHLTITQSSGFNPLRLFGSILSNRNDLNIYIQRPNAKGTLLINSDQFNDVQAFENDDAGMITLKKPKLFYIGQRDEVSSITFNEKEGDIKRLLL